MFKKSFSKLLGLLVGLTLATTAHAQIGPSGLGPFYSGNFYQGFVPTSQFWNNLESNKVDYNPSGISLLYGGTGATNAAQARANLGVLASSLTNGQIYVGSASNVATGVTPSGDMTLSNAGVVAVTGLSHVTNASLANAGLANPSLTINGTSCTLGGSCSLSSGVVSSVSAGTTGLTPSTATSGDVVLAGTVNAAHGGTGQTTFAVGDVLYADTTSTLARLADVATGNVLTSGGVGVAPAWGKLNLATATTGTLAVANGGTGTTTSTGTGSTVLSANPTFTGTVITPALALGGATIGTDALAVTGTATLSGNLAMTSGVLFLDGAGAMQSPSSGLFRLTTFNQTTGGTIDVSTADTFNFLNRAGSSGAAGKIGTLAIGGATIGSDALSVTGSIKSSSSVTATTSLVGPYWQSGSSGTNKTVMSMTGGGSRYGSMQVESTGGSSCWSLASQAAPSTSIGTPALTWCGDNSVSLLGTLTYGGTALAASVSGSAGSALVGSNNPTILNAGLTGTPTAPTATAGTNTTQVATTAFVLANAGGTAPHIVVRAFTSSGTYTPTANTLSVMIECVGGGGGSGGAQGAAGLGVATGGGGSGGYSKKYATAASIGTPSITIGAAGAAGGSGADGGVGGDTIVGSFCTAKGGAQSLSNTSSSVSGGLGGGLTGAVGDIKVPGQPGGGGGVYTSGYGPGGAGGSGPFGPGGLGGQSTAGAAVGGAGLGFGAGGGGSMAYNTTGANGGAAGSAGYVVITETVQ